MKCCVGLYDVMGSLTGTATTLCCCTPLLLHGALPW